MIRSALWIPIRLERRALQSRPIRPVLPVFHRRYVRTGRSSSVAASASLNPQWPKRFNAARNIAPACLSVVGVATNLGGDRVDSLQLSHC